MPFKKGMMKQSAFGKKRDAIFPTIENVPRSDLWLGSRFLVPSTGAKLIVVWAAEGVTPWQIVFCIPFDLLKNNSIWLFFVYISGHPW